MTTSTANGAPKRRTITRARKKPEGVEAESESKVLFKSEDVEVDATNATKIAGEPVVAKAPPVPFSRPVPPVAFEAEEEDDDDEDDEEEGLEASAEDADEDDDDEDDAPPRIPPRRPDSMTPFRPGLGGPGLGGPGGPPRPGMEFDGNAEARKRKMQQMFAVEDDLAELTEGLEFGNNQHEVKLTRTRSNPPGVSKGFLDSFFRRITVGEIKDLYGGGEFLYTIWGPGPDGKRYCKSKKTIQIEGASLVNGMPVGTTVDQGTSTAKDMIKVVLDAKERESQRLVEELKELKKVQHEFMQRDPAAPILAMMRETTERQMQIQREATEREEKRRIEEREERRREDARRMAEEERRRAEERERLEHEKSRSVTDMNSTLQMMQQNTQVLIASLKENASSKEAGFATILQAVQTAQQQQMQTLQANFQQQMAMAQQQMSTTIQQMNAFSDQREKLMMDALKDARGGNKDFASQLVEIAKVKNSMETVFGGGPPQPPGVIESIKEFAASPAAPALLQAFLGNRGAPPAPPPGTLPGMSAPPVAMGSVQVSGPAPQKRLPSPWPSSTGAPPVPKPKQAAKPEAKPKMPVPPTPALAVPPVVAGEVVAVPPVSPTPEASAPSAPAPTLESLGVMPPAADAGNEVKFEALIRALDAAMKADWTVPQMFEGVVVKFPEDVRKTLKETDFDQCLKIIEVMAPSSVLATPQGSQVMRELFTML